MILAKIDDNQFLDLVRKAPVIAFQELEFGYAVAAPGEAYYAPTSHPGGGNLDDDFLTRLGLAFVVRMSKPALRTLAPHRQADSDISFSAISRLKFWRQSGADVELRQGRRRSSRGCRFRNVRLSSRLLKSTSALTSKTRCVQASAT